MADLLFFLGRFHVLALHLPIGILLAAVALDWTARRERYRYLAATAPFLWGVAALTAIITVVLGYLHFAEGGFDGPAANAHRLYGTSVAVAAVLVWWLRAKRASAPAALHLAAGVLVLVLVTLTGHYGGNLTHGSAYLVEFAPAPLRALAGLGARREPVTDLAAADPYLDIVQPLLQQRCGTCHNADKREASFSIATHASTLAGGDTASAVVPGNTAASELYYRITLPPDDEAFMPAEGKTPLTARQVEVLRWWIDAGAPAGTTIGQLAIPVETASLLSAELGLGGPPPQPSRTSGATIAADPAILSALAEAGFLVRQVAQSDPRLIVSVYSPGTAIGPDPIAALLAAAEHIVELDLQAGSIEDRHLVDFVRFSQLRRLRLAKNRVTDRGLRHLEALERLEQLNLIENPGVTDAGIDALARITTLQTLYVWQTRISAEGVSRLRAQRPDLAVQAGTAANRAAIQAADTPNDPQ
jgi:uncharacterized membrane protein